MIYKIMKTAQKIFEKALAVVSLAVILWIALSWSEIAVKNMAEEPIYNKYNIFILFREK